MNHLHAACHQSKFDLVPDRRAEAARYAILQRIAPVLRHDVAGFLQPVRMLMMVLQRRVQMPEPDLQAIADNVASANDLTKEAAAGCMNAMGWIGASEGTAVSVSSGVNEAAALLAMELSNHGLEIHNTISDDAVAIPQSFFRTVLVGAFLAFCDQRMVGSTLQISMETEGGNTPAANRLMLRMLSADVADVASAGSSGAPGLDRQSRRIDWTDVEAMAGPFGVAVARGEGWLAVGLPQEVS